MFPRKRLATNNIMRETPFAWHLLVWAFVDKLPIEQDYLQIFE